MSLKVFHIVFISISALLALGLAGYAVSELTGWTRFIWAGFSLASGIGLAFYGRRFLKRMKHVGNL